MAVPNILKYRLCQLYTNVNLFCYSILTEQKCGLVISDKSRKRASHTMIYAIWTSFKGFWWGREFLTKNSKIYNATPLGKVKNDWEVLRRGRTSLCMPPKAFHKPDEMCTCIRCGEKYDRYQTSKCPRMTSVRNLTFNLKYNVSHNCL